MNTALSINEMTRAYQESDATYSGLFFLGVRTTGIFCRPTCPARKPLPKNVEFFPTVHAALMSGYRPCKRCRPLQADDQPPWVAELLADIEREPAARITDADLKKRGIDPATVRRYFLKQFGMTFQAFTRARRLSASYQHIQANGSVDDAALESGFDSQSGFRDAFLRTFGDPPSTARNGDCVLLSWIQSPLGPLITGATKDGICLLEFSERQRLESQFATVRKQFGIPVVPGSNRHVETLHGELAAYFAGALQSFSVPLVYPGTDFQRRVWAQLLTIPYGETRSYEDIAVALGDRNAVRAVGRANGQNRIAIVIPCHRVVDKSGALGGYGGGLRRKQFLLDLERSSPLAASRSRDAL